MVIEPSSIPPTIFCEENRCFWELVRRFLIQFLKMLDRYYGWETFDKRY